jgi:hypothetical protein
MRVRVAFALTDFLGREDSLFDQRGEEILFGQGFALDDDPAFVEMDGFVFFAFMDMEPPRAFILPDRENKAGKGRLEKRSLEMG